MTPARRLDSKLRRQDATAEETAGLISCVIQRSAAQLVAAKTGFVVSADEPQADLLRWLAFERVLPARREINPNRLRRMRLAVIMATR
jgi:hypothetical protein